MERGGRRRSGYIRRVMAGMKPIANDAGIRDWQAKRPRCQSGPARLDAPWPGRLDVAAISNVRAASRVDSTEINSIETHIARRHGRGGTYVRA